MSHFLRPVSTLRALPLLLLSTSALAHNTTSVSGFGAGLWHPLSGPDHLLAMVSVGLLAAPLGRRGLWIPATFLGAMLLGGLLGMAGLHLPLVEQGVALSVLVVGLLLAFAAQLSQPALTMLAGVIGALHGYAHGTELPESASALEFMAGFSLATAGLHAAGYGLGRLGTQAGRWTRRTVGLGIALVGARLLLG